jgi:hypothetical protein
MGNGLESTWTFRRFLWPYPRTLHGSFGDVQVLGGLFRGQAGAQGTSAHAAISF